MCLALCIMGVVRRKSGYFRFIHRSGGHVSGRFSKRSPDGTEWNPGNMSPNYAALHSGYLL
ncbi:hypothetical protein BH20PSE1_BH20PSE1_23940 [soil metagenome]